MNFQEITSPKTDKDLRLFSMLQLPFFGLLSYLLIRKGWEPSLFAVPLALSGLVAVVGAFKPQWTRPLYVVWMTAVFPIGFAVSHLAMGVVFYLVVTPIGLLRRLTSGDPMQRRLDRHCETYWEHCSEVPPAESYFRQF